MGTTLHFSLLFIFGFLFIAQSKVLEITQKNLPNVLKSLQNIVVLFHHPDCTYSTNYKQKFTQYYHNNPNAVSETVGIVDCSQERTFCMMHRVGSYPQLHEIYPNLTSTNIKSDQYLSNLIPEYENSDQYLAHMVSQKLKASPHFIVALFQEQGMPIGKSNKLRGDKYPQYQDRVFYLSQGRLAQTLSGYVNNKTGCWIYLLKSAETGEIINYYCGDAYQSPVKLQQIIDKFVLQITGPQGFPESVKPIPVEILDASNYQDETVLGYKQLHYWLKHYGTQLEVSNNFKVSMCGYLYLWSNKCQHCDYNSDIKVANKAIEKAYGQWKQKQVIFKHKLHSYDISQNRNIILGVNRLANITGLSQNQINNTVVSNQNIYILPDLIALCFSTDNNRALPETGHLEIYSMSKIIAGENVQQFVNNILEIQYKLGNPQTAQTNENNEL